MCDQFEIYLQVRSLIDILVCIVDIEVLWISLGINIPIGWFFKIALYHFRPSAARDFLSCNGYTCEMIPEFCRTWTKNKILNNYIIHVAYDISKCFILFNNTCVFCKMQKNTLRGLCVVDIEIVFFFSLNVFVLYFCFKYWYHNIFWIFETVGITAMRFFWWLHNIVA